MEYFTATRPTRHQRSSMAEQYEDSYQNDFQIPPVEYREPSEHALAHWRESFDEMEKPDDGHWSDEGIDGITAGFKSSAQMYALTFHPTGMAALAAGVAAELLGHAREKSSEQIKNMRDGNESSDEQFRQADQKLTQAIATRDQTAVRGVLEMAMNLPR